MRISKGKLVKGLVGGGVVLLLAGAALVAGFAFSPQPAKAALATCADVIAQCEVNWQLWQFSSLAECVSSYDSEFNLTCTLPAPSSTCSDDGRVNTNCSAPEILYCSDDTLNFYLYDYATGKGTLDFSVKQSDLPESVEKETLVKQDGSVKLYMEPDGTFKLLAPQPDGKIYFMIFDASDCTSLRESAEWNLK